MLSVLLLTGLILAAQADSESGSPGLGESGSPGLDAADDALKLEVRRLVHQLGAPQLARRQRAEEKLLKLGPRIIDLLPPPSDRTLAEIRERVGRIRQKLQLDAARTAARSSTITLREKSMRLSEVLAEIEKLSGNKIVDFRERFGHKVTDPLLNVDFDQTPFWSALDRVLDQAGLTVYEFGQPQAITLVDGGQSQLTRAGRASYSGPFRIEPIRVMARREFRSPDAESLLLTLSVSWEPRLELISLKHRPADLEAVDENGSRLAPENPQAELEIPGNRGNSAELILPFKLPPRETKEISRVKGRLMALLPGKIETFTFSDLTEARKVEKRIAGVTVTLDRVRKQNAAWEVHIRVEFDSESGSPRLDESGSPRLDAGSDSDRPTANALQSHRGWVLENEAYLEGPDGNPLAHEGMESFEPGKNQIGVTYLFLLDTPPTKHKFIYKTPGAIVATAFDYEIKGVKLP